MGLSSSWLAFVLDVAGAVVAPPKCAACDAPVDLTSAFCARCASTVVRAEPSDDGVTAPFVYGGAIAEAITRFKYGDRPDLARPLGRLLGQATRALSAARLTHVVPVPLHPRRLAERRYNQSALLAALVAGDLRAKLAPRALVRVKDTSQQASLERASRASNVADAFAPRRSGELAGARVLVVDDVMTTGSTLGACRAAALEAGAVEVRFAVVARAERM